MRNHLFPEFLRYTIGYIQLVFILYLKKGFGYAQNYDALTDAKAVATKIRSAGGSKTENIIIDWKHTGDNLSKTREFLDSLL